MLIFMFVFKLEHFIVISFTWYRGNKLVQSNAIYERSVCVCVCVVERVCLAVVLFSVKKTQLFCVFLFETPGNSINSVNQNVF